MDLYQPDVYTQSSKLCSELLIFLISFSSIVFC